MSDPHFKFRKPLGLIEFIILGGCEYFWKIASYPEGPIKVVRSWEVSIKNVSVRSLLFSLSSSSFFSYNLGSGAVLIENNQRVRINQWNKLRAYRNGINGYLEVNGVRVNGSSKPGASQLNLDMEMYLGGAVVSKR